MAGSQKIDLPFVNDREIETLVHEFEACTWPYERWTHRAHLAVGACYARRYAYDEALSRLRENINRYNQACGHHETITVVFLRKIFASLQDDHRQLTELVAELAASCTWEWLYGYYSRDRIQSVAAKSAWLEPDLRPLDY